MSEPQGASTLTNPRILTEATPRDTGRQVDFTSNTIQDETTKRLQEGSSSESTQ